MCKLSYKIPLQIKGHVRVIDIRICENFKGFFYINKRGILSVTCGTKKIWAECLAVCITVIN